MKKKNKIKFKVIDIFVIVVVVISIIILLIYLLTSQARKVIKESIIVSLSSSLQMRTQSIPSENVLSQQLLKTSLRTSSTSYDSFKDNNNHNIDYNNDKKKNNINNSDNKKNFSNNNNNNSNNNNKSTTVSPNILVDPDKQITLHAVTYASHGGSDDRFCRSVESSIRLGYDLIVLGWNTPWLGLSQKLIAAQTYAESLPESHVILFSDAFDILYVDNPNKVLASFLSKGAEILFSAECGCWPHVMDNNGDACFNKYPKAPTPYRYLNSGSWIGFAKKAAAMLKAVSEEAGNNFQNANDQKLVADMFIAGRYGIELDYCNTIFQSMHMTLDPPLSYCNPMESIELSSNGKWKNKLTNSNPSVIHFNGGGKTYHLKMESQMWYKAPEYNTDEKKDMIKKHLVSVPTAINGKLPFEQLCPNYFT